MKAMLKISLLLNFALLSGLLFVLAAGRTNHPSTTPLVQLDNTPLSAAAAVPATTGPAGSEGRPFNWSQVESSDYRTYIANLRSIGCPEQTIRDIITADVDGQYGPLREPLEQKRTGSTLAERAALETGLQSIRKEEAALITGLLGAPPTAVMTSPEAALAPSSGSVPQEPADMTSMPLLSQSAAPSASTLNMGISASASGAASSGSVRKAVTAATSLPLVLQAVDPSVLKLNAQQAQVVNDLGQQFIEEVGGPNQDPNDPAYGQRWQTSQPQADLDLRGMIGIRAWEAYQMSAWATAQDQTPPGP